MVKLEKQYLFLRDSVIRCITILYEYSVNVYVNLWSNNSRSHENIQLYSIAALVTSKMSSVYFELMEPHNLTDG